MTPNDAPQAPTVSALPLSPGHWELDPLHSAVNFTIRHLGIAKVRGRFEQFTAELHAGGTVDDVRGARRSPSPPSTPGTPTGTRTHARPICSTSRNVRR